MELPWAEIKTEYLTTDSGYETLAKKYGCSKALIARRGKKEEWHTEKIRRQEAVNQAVAEATRFDTETAVDRLRTVREAAEAAAGIAFDELTTRRTTMTSKEYRDYVAGLRDLTTMLREFYGIPTYSQQEQLQLARDKLALERQRAQPEQMDNEIRVVMDDDLSEYFK